MSDNIIRRLICCCCGEETSIIIDVSRSYHGSSVRSQCYKCGTVEISDGKIFSDDSIVTVGTDEDFSLLYGDDEN